MINDPEEKVVRPSRTQRREQILDAAVECVLRNGFHGSSMSDIATAADTSVGIIYRHFPHKEALIEAIVARNLTELRSDIALSKAQTREAALLSVQKDIEKFVLRQYDRRRSALTLEVYAEAGRNPKVELIVRRYAKAEQELVKTLITELMPSNTEDAQIDARVDLLRIIADGLLVHGLYRVPKGSLKPMVREVSRTFVSILGLEEVY